MVEFLKFEKSNCKNCYKCIRNCPVKAIRFSGNLASVIPEECILCGKCYVVCPQNAKKIVDETEIRERSFCMGTRLSTRVRAFRRGGIYNTAENQRFWRQR